MHLNQLSDVMSEPLAKLRAKAAEFNAAHVALSQRKPDKAKDPALYEKWSALMSKGKTIKSTISRIMSGVDSVGRAVSYVSEGVESVYGFAKRAIGLDGLGVVPLIVTGAVIASSMTAMTYFISSAYEYGKLADATPEVRAALIKKDEAGMVGVMKGATVLVLVVAAVYLLPKMIKGRK